MRSDLDRLAVPIEACIARRDTGHPAFHGCVDWHSAVHATFALLAISRLTRDPAYRSAALRAVGGTAAIARSVQELRAGRVADELPYGYGWSLILDAEARIEGDQEFNGVAGVTAAALARRLSQVSPAELDSSALSQEYSNSIWPVMCLLLWARIARQPRDASIALRSARSLLAQPEQRQVCDQSGGGTIGFFAPCSLLALVAWLAHAHASSAHYILGAVARYQPLPEASMPTVHSAGLNFSRSWGVIAAYNLTRSPVWLRRFQYVFGYEMRLGDIWHGPYLEYAHWVAQFGVFAAWLQALGPSA